MTSPLAARPIGVFDSGIGGLSVLQALRHELPHEHFVYLADSGNAPYGDAKGDAFVQQRTLAIARWLREHHGIKALVVACNTATAASVEQLRAALPDLPAIGVEPALKPAAASSQTHHVGVLATRGTLASHKFGALCDAMRETHPAVRFTPVACDGLASSIEQWALSGDGSQSRALLDRYLAPLAPFGSEGDATDTLVLGCTHYPLIREQIAHRIPAGVTLIEAGQPVARHAQRLLHSTGLLRFSPGHSVAPPPGHLRLLATGTTQTLHAAALRWLPGATAGAAAPSVATLAI